MVVHLDTPIGELVVYGCVIPWANEPTLANGSAASMWRAHGEFIDHHDLACPTAIDVVAAGLLRSHHLVDHICVTSALAARAGVSCWETTDDNGTRLSDHPTVAVDLD